MPINNFSGEYRFLSNFWMCTVEFEGDYYPSSEHAYQAGKTLNITERSLMRSDCVTPGDAKRYGKIVTLRPGWDIAKIPIMTRIVSDKFKRNPELAKLLIATGDQILIEGNKRHDTFWGTCNGVGQNHLGTILMDVRTDLMAKLNLEQING